MMFDGMFLRLSQCSYDNALAKFASKKRHFSAFSQNHNGAEPGTKFDAAHASFESESHPMHSSYKHCHLRHIL